MTSKQLSWRCSSVKHAIFSILFLFMSFFSCAQADNQSPSASNTGPNNSSSTMHDHENSQLQNSEQRITQLPRWLFEASLKNAPLVVEGILNYLLCYNYNTSVVIPSYHRFILVGEPGTGKTTLARAISELLGYEVIFIQASSLMGKYRNEAAVNIRELFQMLKKENTKKVIIIDELHRLFEHYESKRYDTYENATAFWGQLDEIEKYNHNIVVIGTANRVDKLPPEIMSRFHGKIITLTPPNKKQRLNTFVKIIKNDPSIKLDNSINAAFIYKINKQLDKASLRDVQLLIDTAKIFRYAESSSLGTKGPLVLHQKHFELALKKLEEENTKKQWYMKIAHAIKKASPAIRTFSEIIFIVNVFLGVVHLSYNFFYSPLINNSSSNTPESNAKSCN